MLASLEQFLVRCPNLVPFLEIAAATGSGAFPTAFGNPLENQLGRDRGITRLGSYPNVK